MKRVLIMVTITLFTRLLAAEPIDIKPLIGEEWYGMYMNGQKAGYSVNSLKQESNGDVVITEDATFRINMAGIQQDMRMSLNRVYAADGALRRITQFVEDVGGKKEFNAEVQGDNMLVSTNVAGTVSQVTVPKPRESLKDALKQIELIRDNPEIGKQISFSMFEPMFRKEMQGTSRIERVEQRIFEGAPTKVYKIASTLDSLNLTSYVTEKGTVLEDQFAGLLIARLEPKEVAMDVNYSNDVIISNAVMIKEPIERARDRDTLHLLIKGPLNQDHVINDSRQQMLLNGDTIQFTGHKLNLEEFKSALVPVDAPPDVKQWLEPSLFVQSADPKIVAKAKEIVGDEKDALAISTKLCHWVYTDVETTYSARLSNSLEVLEHPEGDCTEHSMLFIGLARAAGLPAREAAGLIYVDEGKPGFYFHQWASVWVGKWIDVDPTFNQPIADATHIKLAAGDLYEQSKLIPVIGRLAIEVQNTASK